MVTLFTCVTYNNLHSALNLITSIRKTWRSQPRAYVVLVDHFTLDRPGFESVSDVEFISLDALDIPNLGWLRCKFSAAEMCMVVKPFTLRKLMALGAEFVCHVDADFHFFSDTQPFFDELDDADFLTTPHLMSPLPAAEPWERPTLGHVAEGGVLNAGFFLARNSPGAKAFAETWSKLCTMPGAFLLEMGRQEEQHFFNWVYAFSDKAKLSRNPLVNIAYWNLHERPIRWGGLDDGDQEAWYLDGKPIMCFHFSGFAWDQKRLSRYDHRARPYVNANILSICEFYARRLAGSGERYYSAVPYEFGTVDRLALDASIRTELKRSENGSAPAHDMWSSAAPAALHHLNTTLAFSNLIPRYLEPVLLRSDLVPFYDSLFAPRWLEWADRHLWRDHEHLAGLYESFSSFVFRREGLANLTHRICQAVPGTEVSEIGRLLCNDRPLLMKRLASQSAPAELMSEIERAGYRFPAFVPAIAIRLIYMGSPSLRSAFPDIVNVDSAKFKAWLATEFDRTFEASDATLQFVAQFDFDRSIARVVGKCMRIPHLAEEIRRDGLSRTNLVSLVGTSLGGFGYDPNDIVLVDWWLELAGESAQRRVAELLPSEVEQDKFRSYLAAWCRARGIVDAATPEKIALSASNALEKFLLHVQTEGSASFDAGDGKARLDAFSKRIEHGGSLLQVNNAKVQAKLRQAVAPDPRGINVFGYFKSPIGIGEATLGLCKALEVAGYAQRKLTIPNDSMDEDYESADLFQDFGFDCPRNLVVSYPHIEYQLQSVRPRCFFAGRETIGYFAWEQRDFPKAWRERLAPYDKLCALSSFAAESISRGVGRPVDALPCVVEVGSPAPKDVARKRFGIPSGKFVIGFVFDAASSIERKNPAAVVDAVAKAFGHSDDVLLVLKVGNGARPDFAQQMADIRRRAAPIRGGTMIITDHLPKRDVETLMCAFDVYLSLHRSEGFGYTVAEAMLLGVPTVATRYSGNLDFMTEDNSFLIECKEVVVRTREGPFETGTVWAEPDADHAVETLRQIRENYQRALDRARDSAAGLADIVSASAVAKAATRIIEAPAVRI